MSEEVQNLAENLPAQVSEDTASTDNVASLPESIEAVSEAEEKKFTQAEIDAMISKRLAREQRKWEREQKSRQSEVQPSTIPDGSLSIAQFDTPEEYAEALAAKRADEIVAQRRNREQRTEIDDVYAEREELARDKYDDFDQIAYNPNLRVTEAMAETIKASDNGPDLIYWLGSHPKEADRISRLSPLMQAREIGKIEGMVNSEPPPKKTTSAPDPIRPIRAPAVNNGSTDTTDPRSTRTMSTSEWIAAERKRQLAKAQTR